MVLRAGNCFNWIFTTCSKKAFICFTHFDEEDFETKKGKGILKWDAYPKELNAQEKAIMEDNIVPRYNKPAKRKR